MANQKGKKNIEMYQEIAENEPEKAEWAKNMIDKFYQKDLDKYESAIAKIREHNSNIDMRGE